jgi:DNA replication protein DnaC
VYKTAEPKNQLDEYLKELHLTVVRSCYQETIAQAIQESLSYEDFLTHLIQQEYEVRWNKRTERRLRESRLPISKSLDNFDMTRLSTRLHQQVKQLLQGDFVARRENLLAFGNPGSGKTHLLCAIAQELVRLGYKVIYTNCSYLIQKLLAAKRNLNLPNYLRRMSSYEVIFIDDLGYVQQSREEMEVLFTLLADRYERGSVFITSNMPFSKWEEIFKDPMTTAAAIDRLVHHSIILELNLPSYRMEQAQKLKTTRQEKEVFLSNTNKNSLGDSAEK